MNAADLALLRQHLIDPEICIRCNTCEAICPQQAITHDARNYVVDVSKCNGCNDCLAPCPTGAIDHYRTVPRRLTYPLAEQIGWDTLPAELTAAEWAARLLEAGAAQGDALGQEEAEAVPAVAALEPPAVATLSGPGGQEAQHPSAYGASVPPWSAAHPYTNLYGPKAAIKTITATVTGNLRVTEVGQQAGQQDYDTHHIVLDFGSTPFPVLEGQSIGIVPPGVDAQGRPHRARQYSIASPRNGERPGHNNLSLTIKRVLEDHSGQAVRGVGSNYMCDLKVGDKVQVIGPFGSTFLMPNHPKSHIVMICTGTGSAPMRAMTEWRRRLRAQALAKAELAGAGWESNFQGGKLILFFGARTQQELPYFGPLQNLPKDFIDINFAFSRIPGQPKRYVQHAMVERAPDLGALLVDSNAYFYVCGLKAMEEGVLAALRDIAHTAGLDWAALSAALKREGRLHLETY